jgi:putative phage-type endonuclease
MSNIINIRDITEFQNIIDQIVPEETNYFNEEDSMELYETCIHIMEEFIKNNPTIISEPDFDEIFEENIKELIDSHFDNDIFFTEEAEEEIDAIIDQAKTDFFKDFIPIRSYPSSIILEEPDYDFIEDQISYLKSKPQPIQRTKEWYEFRHNLITASNAYKAFDSQSTKNQLIYEKCQHNPALDQNSNSNINSNDLDNDTKNIKIQLQPQPQMVNINTTMHWGQKYEPLSVMIYEDRYKTKIDDFGCIQHDKYSFLGASPDGINVDKTSLRYGRMLEIKNIVNREIDGIPKKEYWIQMQLQMEVCDLDECDFLETKFVEYENADAFYNDTTDKYKGVIMYFHKKDGAPFYKYMPLDLCKSLDINTNLNTVNEWQEQMIDLYQSNEYNYVWIKDYYWKLDIVSCVLVCRNKQWFNDNINELADIWSIIVSERVSGFEHRAPNRKTKMMDGFAAITNSNASNSSGCLLNFNKETGKITVVKSGLNEPMITKLYI